MAVTTTYSVQLLGLTDVPSVDGSNGDVTSNPDTVAFKDGRYYTAADDTNTGAFGHAQITVRGFDNLGRSIGLYQLYGSDPSIVALSDDTIGVVGTNPSGNIVLWKRGLGDNTTSTQTTLEKGSNPEIACSPDSLYPEYTVVWEAIETNGSSIIRININKINGYLYKPVDYGNFNDHNPSVAWLDNRNVVVAWDRTDASGFSSIWYAVFDDDGDVVTAPTRYDATGLINREPSVAAHGTGFSIAYEDSESGDTTQIALFDRSSDGRVTIYKQTGIADGPDREASSADLGGTYATSFTHVFLDVGQERERDIYVTLHDPETGAVLGDPAKPFFIGANGSSSSIAADPGYAGRFVVSYFDEFNGYVRQQVAKAVMTITGDATDQYLYGRPGLAVSIDGGGGNDGLVGSSGDDRLIGNTGDDSISPGSGDDVIDGGTGIDTLNISGPVTIDLSKTGPQDTGRGLKTIRGIENITGVSSSSETMIGNDAANVFDAGGIPAGNQPGLDTMIGNGGDDTYIVNRSDTVVRETSASGGTDLVIADDDFVLPDNVENLTLRGYGYVPPLSGTGNGLANRIEGNAAANTLDGKAGADTMIGGADSDIYYVDNAGDRCVEANGAVGVDLVYASVSYSLAGSELENLTLTGTASINGSGNSIVNVLTGNGGANILNGMGGADTMIGGAGSDTYYVDSTGDRCIEASGAAGTDSIRSSVSYSLDGSGVENLTLLGTGNLNGVGSASVNLLTGNAGINILNGLAGADTMVGGAGSDTYYVDNAGDRCVEANGASGIDSVRSYVSYSLGGSELENLTLIGTGNLNGTGNSIANVLTGNGGANVLNGLEGGDTLFGGAGADTFVFSTGLGASNVDRLADFSHADDTIQLARSVFTALSAGKLASGAFKDVAAAKIDADDRILYDHDTGALSYDVDGSGAKAAVQFATLLNKPTNLAFDDFSIV